MHVVVQNEKQRKKKKDEFILSKTWKLTAYFYCSSSRRWCRCSGWSKKHRNAD